MFFPSSPTRATTVLCYLFFFYKWTKRFWLTHRVGLLIFPLHSGVIVELLWSWLWSHFEFKTVQSMCQMCILCVLVLCVCVCERERLWCKVLHPSPTAQHLLWSETCAHKCILNLWSSALSVLNFCHTHTHTHTHTVKGPLCSPACFEDQSSADSLSSSSSALDVISSSLSLNPLELINHVIYPQKAKPMNERSVVQARCYVLYSKVHNCPPSEVSSLPGAHRKRCTN